MTQSNSVGHIIIPQDKVPAAAYQAIYHKLTSKIEKLHQYFDDAYTIGVSDIVQLNDMLCQLVRQYAVESQSSTCSISFHKDEKITTSSIEKFRIINFSTQKPTEALEYIFDFYTILPVEIKEAEDIVQRFKVIVKVDQDFIEESEGMPFFVRGIVSGKNILLVIEYSDYAVGRNLQVCVQDWVDNLPSKKIPKTLEFFEKQVEFLGVSFPYIFVAACLFGLSKFGVSEVGNSYEFILKSLSIASLMYIIGRTLSVKFFDVISRTKPLTFIKITNGDMARSKKLEESRSKKKAFAVFLGSTLVFGVIANLFSEWIISSVF